MQKSTFVALTKLGKRKRYIAFESLILKFNFKMGSIHNIKLN